MDIRASKKDFKKISEVYNKSKTLNRDVVSLNEDPSIDDSRIMIKTGEGELVEWTRGVNNIISFIEYGYVRIIKKCPYRMFGKCKGEKCQLYVIKNNAGDCALTWTGVLSRL